MRVYVHTYIYCVVRVLRTPTPTTTTQHKSTRGLHPLEALGGLVKVALALSKLAEFTGREEPTVIT